MAQRDVVMNHSSIAGQALRDCRGGGPSSSPMGSIGSVDSMDSMGPMAPVDPGDPMGAAEPAEPITGPIAPPTVGAQEQGSASRNSDTASLRALLRFTTRPPFPGG